MVAISNPTHRSVLRTGTSARSRPSTNVTEESEEMDCDVVIDSPGPLERVDRILNGVHV